MREDYVIYGDNGDECFSIRNHYEPISFDSQKEIILAHLVKREWVKTMLNKDYVDEVQSFRDKNINKEIGYILFQKSGQLTQIINQLSSREL